MSVPRVLRPAISLTPDQIKSVWEPLGEALLESNEPVDVMLTPNQTALLKQKLLEKDNPEKAKKQKRKGPALFHR